MFEKIKGDFQIYYLNYKHYGLLKRIFYLFFTQELYGVLIYRFGHWAEYECKIPIIKFIFRFFYFFLRKISVMLFSIEVYPESEIGPGLKIEHWGCVQIKAKMGSNCRVQQQVVIGHIGGFKGGGVPVLGNNVYVGVGAKIIGEIKIGDNAFIGANAVVIKDVPENGVAVGVPAKVVKYRG